MAAPSFAALFCALVFPIALSVSSPEAAASLAACDPPPPGSLSAASREALGAPMLAGEDWGWRNRARRVRQNRRDLATGLVSREQADERGGLAMIGTFGVPVLPFHYANRAPPYSRASLEKMLFTGPWPTGTLDDYFDEVSYGLFGVTGEVADWAPLPNEDLYYEDGDWGMGIRGTKAAWESCVLGDASIDFSQYDNDGDDGIPNSGDDDGKVDFAIFVSPEIDGVCDKYKDGICGTVGVANDNIWAHKTTFQYWFGKYFYTNDPSANPVEPDSSLNTAIDVVLIIGGLGCDGMQNGIAVYAHEIGHALDIADLYDINPWPFPNSRGIGRWGIMSTGTWNTPQRPSHPTAWTKERLGWLNYFVVNQDLTNLCLPPVETTPIAARVWTQGAQTAEYFVVENRQPIGFDENLYGPGLVIYHVDETVYDAKEGTNTVNETETHKAIDVECADAYFAGHGANADHLDDTTNCGDAGDPWCAETDDTFDGSSIPDSRAYSGAATGVAVKNIGSCNSASAICADFDVGTALAANLCMVDCPGDGCAEISLCDRWWASDDLWLDNGNGASYPAEGMPNRLHFRVKNVGPSDLAGVQVDLIYREPGTGLWWPDSGTLIETFDVPDVLTSGGGSYEGFVDFDYPVPPVGVDHYCLGAVARHPLDPQNSSYPPSDNNVVQVNHQVFVERAEGGLPAGADCGGFAKSSRILVYGRTDYGRTLQMRLGSPPNFDDAVIPVDWNLAFDSGLFVLFPGQEDTVMVDMTAASVQHGDTAHVPLTWWDVENQIAAGGVILDYRIDCFGPAPVAIQSAECVGPYGDSQSGPTIKVTWDPPTLDTAGSPEVVKFYEVYRADDQGHPEALVDRVAIDAEFGESGFQWYDSVPRDTVTVYSYRVRPVDAADNAGPPSPWFVANCGGPVGVAPLSVAANGVALASPFPNPFRTTTSLEFTLDRDAGVRLEVFDAAGRRIRTLMDRVHAAGRWSVTWDGRGADGSPVPSGIYLVRLEAGDRTAMRTVSLIR